MYTAKEKILTLALVLCIAGVAGFGWSLSEQKKEKQLLLEQQEKLNTKIAELDKLLDGKMSVRSLSANVSDENLQRELDRYQKKETTTISDILTISIICLAIGVTILIGWLLLLIVHCILTGLIYVKKFSVNIFGHLRQVWNKQPIKICLEKIKNIFRKPGLNKPDKSKENRLTKNELPPEALDKEDEKIDMLYCDEKTLNPKEQVNAGAGSADLNAKMLGQLEHNIRKTILSGYHENTLKVQNSLKTQNETIEKQVAEVIQITQTIQEASAKNSEPVRNSLDELAKQVSAIREYTCFQQDRIEKLQEGYDWNIVRNFCLRVIRCIDNLEDRIARLSEQNIDTTDLKEIMDELVFTLESSGVETFKPEINSDYNGKERIAEVVKDKVHPNNPNMRGKIAEVVKPGYQYVIDDANVKVVRAARVKLFW